MIIEKLEKLYSQKNIKYTFWSAVIIGLFSHGYMLTNKFSYHDDLGNMFSVGATYTQGRWFLGMMSKFTRIFLGGDYSIPFFNGLLSILLVAVMACVVVNVLDIQNIVNCILTGGIAIAYPVVACTLGYGFTSYYYFVGLLLTALAVVAAVRKRSIWNVLVAAVLLCLSLGTYQAYFPVAAVLLVLLLFKQAFAVAADWKEVLKNAFYYLSVLLSGMVLYLLATSVLNKIRGIELTAYANMDSMGKISLADIPGAIRNVFAYFAGKDVIIYNLFDGFAGISCYVLYVVTAVLFVALCVLKKSNWQLMAERLCFFICLPFAVNLICIMSPTSQVYSLMVYPMMFIFVIPLFLVELLDMDKASAGRIVHGGLAVLIGISILFYVRMDNRFYLKEEFLKEQTNSYFTTLVTQIKSLDGYSDELPVAYLNLENFHDETLAHIEPFTGIELRPFHRNELITEASMAKYIEYWCGYSPEIIEDEERDALLEREEVQNMSSYPDDGGIQIIDGIIVVKF